MPHEFNDPCTVEGCSRTQANKKYGLCEAHYYRLRMHGDVLADKPVRYRTSTACHGDVKAIDCRGQDIDPALDEADKEWG